MAALSELLQGVIAAAIVALIIVLCCLFYFCRIRKEKAKRNAILESITVESQNDSVDGQTQSRGSKSKEDNRRRQERKRRLQQIVQEHQQWEGQPLYAQLRKSQELDLHNYTVKEAMEAFELFLGISLDDYQDTPVAQKRFIHVITGRGKHSKDGVPVIKMAVSEYLAKHSYTHSWPNPGMVMIDLLSKRQNSEQGGRRQKYLGCSVM